MPGKFSAWCVLLAVASTAHGQIDVGSDGSDGPLFLFDEDITTVLAEAALLCDCDGGGTLDDPCRWDCPSPVAGKGVYDAEQWAVVFKYSTMEVREQASIRYSNHPSRAPVIILVSGSATIEGDIRLNGVNGHPGSVAATWAEPGPGGFRGGRGTRTTIDESGGFGPGGGFVGDSESGGTGGSYASLGVIGNYGGGGPGEIYGNARILPLVGGSGGSSSQSGGGAGGGGAGGGAILIAADNTISVKSTAILTANGGVGGDGWNSYDGGAGSGGAIRLVANEIVIEPNANLQAIGGGQNSHGGAGGIGRIRLDANTFTVAVKTLPAATMGLPELIFPPSESPLIRATMLSGQPISPDPKNGFFPDDVEVTLPASSSLRLMIDAFNVPVTSTLTVRVSPANQPAFTTMALFAEGDEISSSWIAAISPPTGAFAVQVRAELP